MSRTAMVTVTPLGADGEPCGPSVEAEAVYVGDSRWEFVGDVPVTADGRTIVALRIVNPNVTLTVGVGS